jgi:hypothetical protein
MDFIGFFGNADLLQYSSASIRNMSDMMIMNDESVRIWEEMLVLENIPVLSIM